MYPTLRRQVLTMIPIVVLATSACTTGQASPSASPAGASPSAAGGGTTVQVTLQEWAVVPASSSTAVGEVTFQVTNNGPADIHEFVVVKTDLDAGALPVDATGAVTETGAGIVVIGEIEDIPVGTTQDLKVTLAAGKYVLLCNIYSAEEKEAHYKMGMRTAFEAS